MRKLALPLILILHLVFIGCNGKKDSFEEGWPYDFECLRSEGLKKYEHSSGDFAIDLPESWTPFEDTLKPHFIGVNAIDTAIDMSVSPEEAIFEVVGVTKTEGRFENLYDIHHESKKEFLAENPDVVSLRQGRAALNGLGVTWHLYRSGDPTFGEFYGFQILVPRGDEAVYTIEVGVYGNQDLSEAISRHFCSVISFHAL